MHKSRMTVFVLLLSLTMARCGSNGSSPGAGNINGTWSATLTNADGSPAYTFSTTFTQGSGSTLTVTSFTFTLPGPCFAPYSGDQYAETGSFALSGNFNGSVSGTFGMTITTIFPSTTNNVLTLNGTVNGNTITGNWNAAGLTGCSGSGTFKIQPTAG